MIKQCEWVKLQISSFLSCAIFIWNSITWGIRNFIHSFYIYSSNTTMYAVIITDGIHLPNVYQMM